MNQQFHAIYEDGVLRLITPVNLPERAEVTGTLESTLAASTEIERAALQRQQEALNAMFAEVDNLPQTPHADGLSGRDHDQILYGSGKCSSSTLVRGTLGTSLMTRTIIQQ